MTDLEALLGLDRLGKVPVIPIAKMIALWNCDIRNFTVTKLKVMNIEDQTRRTDAEYPFSAGCCHVAWLTSPLSTPLGVFTMLLADGFPNQDDVRAALYQFRKVEGQKDWTSDMLLRLFDPDIERILDEEELADEE